MPPIQSLPGLPDDFTSKLFHGDVVTKINEPSFRGKVVRGWTDEDVPPDPVYGTDPLMPLIRGEVMISNNVTGHIEVVPEMGLQLFERVFMKGDLVKHALTDLESAVVVSVSTECQIEQVISGERVHQWVPWEKLKNALQIEAKDKVVYDEWIGTVEEVFEDGAIEAQDGSLYRIAEMGGLLETGRFASEVLPDHAEFLGQYSTFPEAADPQRDRVIGVRPLIVFVVWNALNQTLPIAEHDKHPEPKRFWCGADVEKLTHFEGLRHQVPPLGTTVVFRDAADEKALGAKSTLHLKGTYRLNVFKIVENRTMLRVRWQDGTETEEWSVGFVPYRNVDDYESWPGEHLVWRSDTGKQRPAVVQSYNPRQRIAELLLTDTKDKETVSVLELDTGGFGKATYGVALGQIVLFCDDNGAPTPEVPSLGQVEPAEDGRDGFRAEMQRLGMEYGVKPEAFGSCLPQGDPTAIKWWGEVVDLYTDGTISVELFSGERRRVDIRKVIILNERFADDFPEDEEDGYQSDHSWETIGEDARMGEEYEDTTGTVDSNEHYEDATETIQRNGSVHMSDDEEMDIDEDEQDARDAEAVEPLVASYVSPRVSFKSLQSESDRVLRSTPAAPAAPAPASPTAPAASTSASGSASTSADAGPSTVQMPPRPSLADDDKWVRFDILEQSPADHHYASQPRQQASSKTYHSRLVKEHRALASSLPENILVRTYEDRTDLMRVLIVGPEGTPYADAPFVFDVYLDPTKFPFEPPLVYFHSHTNGLGRCNPNLYEEGKVCLSILGTWAGDKSESWSSKSSLLQVFVSISGLVLVRSPYHCEPAFAKLEGTREGRVNSRLYSEKAYVLSRSFVRQALLHPPSGLQDEIRHLYFDKGRLACVIAHARRLIEKGDTGAEDEENEDMWNADAMGSLTMGAILTLKRTLTALEKIQASG